MVATDVLDTLKQVFPNVHFNVKAKINDDIKHIFDSSNEFSDHLMEPDDELFFVLKGLESDLREALRNLKKIKHSHKNGHCSIEKVHTQQYLIIDLEAEIHELTEYLGLD